MGSAWERLALKKTSAKVSAIRIQSLYEEYNFLIVFTAGFTPIPFKLFTVSAGAFEINFGLFILASIVSRSARFFLVAGLIKKYGEPIREFIDNYFTLYIFIKDWLYLWMWNAFLDVIFAIPIILGQGFKAIFSTWLGFWILKKLN